MTILFGFQNKKQTSKKEKTSVRRLDAERKKRQHKVHVVLNAYYIASPADVLKGSSRVPAPREARLRGRPRITQTIRNDLTRWQNNICMEILAIALF